MLEAPLYLYKFRSLSSDTERERTRDIILTNSLWFSRPVDFNDPFDCVPVSSMTKQEVKKYIAELYKRRCLSLPRGHRLQLAAKFVNRRSRDGSGDAADAKVRRGIDQAVNTAGILSLSADPTHVLMWSHYSSSHTGICLRFNCRNPPSYFLDAQQVIYSEDRPTVNFQHDNKSDLLEKSIFRKAHFWSYEQEWRVIKPDGPGVYKFPAASLDGVIFGAKTTSENQTLVLGWAGGRSLKVQTIKAEFDPNQFKLNLSQIN